MIEIRDLLGRFNNLLIKGEFKKEIIRSVLEEVVGVPILSKDIKIKNGIIFLDIKPIYKNEILIKKDKINYLLQKALNTKTPNDFR